METETQKGYVCPQWANEMWDAKQCTVEETVLDNWAVVCPVTQQTIYIGETEKECWEFLGY
jgi:hypothetical protein